jgi:transposase
MRPRFAITRSTPTFRAFAFWGGACERGIYDNMKTAVDAVFVGKDRKDLSSAQTGDLAPRTPMATTARRITIVFGHGF